MFIEEFSFGNFRSFKEIQTLRMSAAKIVSPNKSLDEDNVIKIGDKTKLLKSKVIYGANASGKSNVIKALFYFQLLSEFSLKDDRCLVTMERFRYSTENDNEPCFFQLIFYIDNIKYRYGFEASSEKIHNEWLFATHNEREINIFLREGLVISKITKKYMPKAAEISNLKTKLLTDKVLFLSLVESFKDSLAETLIKGITSIYLYHNYIENKNLENYVNEFLKDENNKNGVLKLLKYADVNIDQIDLQKVKNKQNEEEDLIISIHSRYNENMEKIDSISAVFNHFESDGTQQMLKLSPFLLTALAQGAPVIIDEFGSQLHPLLIKKIFSLFNSNKNTKSQIIAATHTTELMSSDLLRKDQIDFVEKDKYGRSYLYTLVELKGVRNNASFEKDYFKGKYGAIPFLGNWEELLDVCDKTIEEDEQ